ncbi:DUF2721 domain-containing protein [Gemmata sp.]|uniref:DUF2721 domain-containing protein n=1 Tax=Gemmata sp. TaxID=1914242 RepID=UPI003F70FD8D
MSLPEIDLPKIAGVAGSAVGLIIATAIFQSWVTARYVPAFDRYRALTGELRGYKDQTRRRGSLREQIHAYHNRLICMSRASCLLCWVMVCAIVAIAAASLAVAFPPKEELTGTQVTALSVIATAGALAVGAALVLDLVAVGLVITENRIDRRSIEEELADLDEVNGSGSRIGRPPG